MAFDTPGRILPAEGLVASDVRLQPRHIRIRA
jgi:hypothetical protein